MPDWKQIVRRNFHGIEVCSPDFIEELAAHLEDTYEALLCDGLPAEAALQHTISQIDARYRVCLVRRFLQEELMTGFIKKVALPGLVTIAAANVLYWALQLGHFQHEVLWLLGGQSPLWWWYGLPIFGVFGAILARYNGGSPLQRMAASLLPSAILNTIVLLIFVVGFTFSGFTNHYQLVATRLESMGLVPPGFAVIPAVFSLLGAGIAEFSEKELLRLA